MGTCASTGARNITQEVQRGSPFPELVRVMIIGQTGNGKSSLGNTLLQNEVFNFDNAWSATTTECMWKHGLIDGTSLSVTDTPGLSNLSKEEIIKELSKSFVLTCPGPHVVIIVLRCDRPFTKEEHTTVMTLLDLLVDKDRRFLMIVFAGGDSLSASEDGMQLALQNKLLKAPESLNEVLKESGGAYCAVDNTGPCQEGKRKHQATLVFSMIKTLIKRNNGECFTNERWEEYNKIVQAEVELLQKTKHLSQTEAENQVRNAVVEGRSWERIGERMLQIGKDYIVPAISAARGLAPVLGLKF